MTTMMAITPTRMIEHVQVHAEKDVFLVDDQKRAKMAEKMPAAYTCSNSSEAIHHFSSGIVPHRQAFTFY